MIFCGAYGAINEAAWHPYVFLWGRLIPQFLWLVMVGDQEKIHWTSVLFTTERSPIPPWSAEKGPETGDVVSRTPVGDSFALAPIYNSQLVDPNKPSLSSKLPKIRSHHMAPADGRKTDPFADLEEQFGEFQSAHKSCTWTWLALRVLFSTYLCLSWSGTI